MLAQDHLKLQTIRLKSTEEWVPRQGGLHFLFPRGGAGKCTVGHSEQRIAPGNVVLLRDGGGGKLCAASGGGLTFWCFSLRVEHLFPLFGATEIALLKNVADDLGDLKVYPASNAVAAECHRLVAGVPPQFNLDYRGQLVRIAAALLSEEFKVARRQRAGFVRIEEHLLQVFENLSSDIILNASILELAERFGCGQRHLNRLFHQYFDFSAAALKMEMRLVKAAALLRDPDVKVITVAEQCGFNHLGLFNTCFKRRFGVSPGRWRKGPSSIESRPATQIEGDPGCRLRETGLCPWFKRPAGKSAAASRPAPACQGVRSVPSARSHGNGSEMKPPEVIVPTACVTRLVPVGLQP
jgi:AraC-like DNA-binding protein